MTEIDVHSTRGRGHLLNAIRDATPSELMKLDDELASLRPSPGRDAMLAACEDEVRRRDLDGPQRNAVEREQELAVRNGDGQPRRFSSRTSALTPRERFSEAIGEDRSARARKAAQARWSGQREKGGADADE